MTLLQSLNTLEHLFLIKCHEIIVINCILFCIVFIPEDEEIK